MELLENKENAASDKNEVRFTEEDHLEMEGKSKKKTFEKQITPFIFTDTEAYLSSQLDNKSLWECFSLIWSAWSGKPVIPVKGFTWVLNFGIWIFR